MARKRKNKLITNDYYSLDKITQSKTPYYIIIGERSNGKTYSVKDRIKQMLYDNPDAKFVYLRRRHDYIVRTKTMEVFADINDKVFELLGSYINYSPNKGFYLEDDEDKQIGWALSVEDAYKYKGVPFKDVKIILFDEFIDKEYMEKEIELFINIISTVTRGNECEIFMLANTVSRNCPYFDLFGIDVSKLRKGTINIVHHHNGVSATIEYCKTLVFDGKDVKSKKNKYVGFDGNETVQMVMFGDWEHDNLPTTEIDGVMWNCKSRILIPIYFSDSRSVYEISIKLDGIPVGFCRRVNTQDGKVNAKIRFNISPDCIKLSNKNGAVPTFRKPSKILMGEEIFNYLSLFLECVKTGRVLYTNALDGTEFLQIIERMK